MIIGNLKFVEYLGPYLVEGMYEKKEPHLKNFIKFLDDFKSILEQYSEQEQEYYKKGLKDTLIILLNHPEDFALNNWFKDFAFYYLDDDKEIHLLLQLFWNYFFSNEDWNKNDYKREEYKLEASDIDV